MNDLSLENNNYDKNLSSSMKDADELFGFINEDCYGIEYNSITKRPFFCIDISIIYSRIYLGSYTAAANIESGLHDFGITHILTVGDDMKPSFPSMFHYQVFELEDHHLIDISQYFEKSFQFIDLCLNENKNNKILIHCFAGISRSATITIAYLIRTFRMTFSEALEHVRKSRHWINPNTGFRKQLLKFSIHLGLIDLQYKKYEKAAIELAKMHFDKKIDYTTYQRIIKTFHQVFGKYHPHTLDVELEMKLFLDTIPI